MNYYEELAEPRFVDIHGKEVKRHPYNAPYNYDEFVVWKGNYEDGEAYSGCYSDRLMQWDYTKYHNCCQQVFHDASHTWYDRSPDDIQKFLSLYLEEEIELVAVIQGCNASTGNPYWAFLYKEKEDSNAVNVEKLLRNI